MITISGKSVFNGIAIGALRYIDKQKEKAKCFNIENAEEECLRFQNARHQAILQLDELYKSAVETVGEEEAMILLTHQIMLDDMDFIEGVEDLIKTQHVNAEFAVDSTSENIAQIFMSMDDEYMQGRAADVIDISRRVTDILTDQFSSKGTYDEPCIIIANELSPSDTVQLDKAKVKGIVTKNGTATSHTAILAKTMNIPALIGTGDEIKPEYDGKFAALDGYCGKLYIEPDEDILSELRKKQKDELDLRLALDQLKGRENITRNGRRINLYANAGSLSDVTLALENDADGIGLFRSEMLYLERNDFPSEEEQLAIYRRVLEKMAGKKVIIRTLDIGADKQLDYFEMHHEENPAMGFRAIRFCLSRKEVFKTQLRALYRASVYGNLSIMFPMIISVDEMVKIRNVIDEVRKELTQSNIPFKDDVELGIMIETPAAVMISKELAAEVDFFSIGTNDLTQYTLAVDRQNSMLNEFYDPFHPAIMTMIKMVIDNAHEKNIWVGICGELASDKTITDELIDMGIDELSVSPGMVLPIRQKIIEHE